MALARLAVRGRWFVDEAGLAPVHDERGVDHLDPLGEVRVVREQAGAVADREDGGAAAAGV